MSPRARETGERHYEGEANEAGVSLILVDTAPGDGPRLHRHEYEEVFAVHAGTVTFTVGDDTLEAGPGDVLIAPAGVPHGFVNSGSGRLRMVAVHVSPKFVTEWLE
jgi:mannose-6-phosphate isomerase-like protein (cupin superfamily)